VYRRVLDNDVTMYCGVYDHHIRGIFTLIATSISII